MPDYTDDTKTPSAPEDRTVFGRKQIQGYKAQITGELNADRNGATVELDFTTARALVHIIDQLLGQHDRDQVRISEMATAERDRQTLAEIQYDAGHNAGVLAGQRSMLLALGAGGVAFSSRMLLAAQDSHSRGPEYGITDQDMKKAIRAALRELGKPTISKRKRK